MLRRLLHLSIDRQVHACSDFAHRSVRLVRLYYVYISLRTTHVRKAHMDHCIGSAWFYRVDLQYVSHSFSEPFLAGRRPAVRLRCGCVVLLWWSTLVRWNIPAAFLLGQHAQLPHVLRSFPFPLISQVEAPPDAYCPVCASHMEWNGSTSHKCTVYILLCSRGAVCITICHYYRVQQASM